MALAKKTLHHFRHQYDYYREKIDDYFKDGTPRQWEFAPQLVFFRFDKFLMRVEMVHVSMDLVSV